MHLVLCDFRKLHVGSRYSQVHRFSDHGALSLVLSAGLLAYVHLGKHHFHVLLPIVLIARIRHLSAYSLQKAAGAEEPRAVSTIYCLVSVFNIIRHDVGIVSSALQRSALTYSEYAPGKHSPCNVMCKMGFQWEDSGRFILHYSGGTQAIWTRWYW